MALLNEKFVQIEIVPKSRWSNKLLYCLTNQGRILIYADGKWDEIPLPERTEK